MLLTKFANIFHTLFGAFDAFDEDNHAGILHRGYDYQALNSLTIHLVISAQLKTVTDRRTDRTP